MKESYKWQSPENSVNAVSKLNGLFLRISEYKTRLNLELLIINDPLHVKPMSALRRKHKIKRKQDDNDDDTVPREWVVRFP